MATISGIGFSQQADPIKAAREAAENAKTQLNKNRIDIAFLFHSVHYDPQVILPVIYKQLKQTKIIGASTAGVILSDRVEMCGIGIMAIYSEDINFEAQHVSHLHLQLMHEAGRMLIKDTVTGFGLEHRKLFFVLTDGLLHNLTDMIQGIQDELNPKIPIIGAGSSDDFQFKKTYQHFNNKTLDRSVVGIFMGGHFSFGIGCKHGLRPLGRPRTIDKIENNLIKTIDHHQAAAIYSEYFEEEANTLNQSGLGQINIRYPLGVLSPHSPDYLLRNVHQTLEDGSLVCQDKVQEGSEVHIMIGSKDSLINAAEDAALAAKKQLGGHSASFVVVIESLLRQKFLGKQANAEIQKIRNVFGDSTPLIGMYSHGEILTGISESQMLDNSLKNESIIVLAVH